MLLSQEGINLFVAGTEEQWRVFRDFLELDCRFQGLPYKASYTDYQPFTRMLVRIKKEIISWVWIVLSRRKRPRTLTCCDIEAMAG